MLIRRRTWMLEVGMSPSLDGIWVARFAWKRNEHPKEGELRFRRAVGLNIRPLRIWWPKIRVVSYKGD